MQALVLAAGKGSRIADDIDGAPKSTLEIDGEPIIRRSVELLLSHGISVCVCTGYKPTLVRAALDGLDVEYRHNPFFDVSNNIGSLWVSRDWIDDGDDFIIVSADVVFDTAFIERLMSGSSSLITTTVDTSRIPEGDYFFSLDSDGRILEYGAKLEEEKRDCAYIGIIYVHASAVGAFIERLEQLMFDARINDYFEEVAFSFIGDQAYWPGVLDMAGCSWYEIDNYGDYERASEGFSDGGNDGDGTIA